uniref:Uncharacterized protein n=1 Tax=Glycine max TaxID=3847 RepID=C6TDX8_SOYBN|nr:unknown [Glycine max]
MGQTLYSRRCIHFVEDHLFPLITGQPPCKLDGSSVASGLMLQNSRASPIFGFTERPFLAHWDKSFHQGTELKFALAAGNTVSPPSSTSERYIRTVANTLASILSVELIKEVIIVRLIFLSYFVVKNLKSSPFSSGMKVKSAILFSIFWTILSFPLFKNIPELVRTLLSVLFPVLLSTTLDFTI